MIKASGADLEGRWNRALFYSRALENGDALPVDLEHTPARRYAKLSHSCLRSSMVTDPFELALRSIRPKTP